MKKLKILALSDMHLGEGEGILHHDPPNVLDTLVNKIAELSKGDEEFEGGIEELILIGDIADLSEARERVAFENTRVFLTELLKKIDVEKVVYVPGNHDHNLWVQMLKEDQDKDDYRDCNPKTGYAIKNPNLLISKCFPGSYKGAVEAHYPYYMIDTDSVRFLFDHGHLFSSLLTKWAGDVKSLEEIENKTWVLMELIWVKGKTPLRIKFNDYREKVYDLLRAIRIMARYPNRKTRFNEDSAAVYDDKLRGRIVNYLDKLVGADTVTKDFHLVFGHTHHGGRVLEDDRKVRVRGHFINIWNTGGWLVPSNVFSPDAYVFYVERNVGGLIPRAYKLVAREDDEEGDYDRSILEERVKEQG
jgi:UDP-2,3-diacylglucosamine pyrophosphatase LpxH